MIQVTPLRVETIKSENEFTLFALKANYKADYLDLKFLFSRNCVVYPFSLLVNQKTYLLANHTEENVTSKLNFTISNFFFTISNFYHKL